MKALSIATEILLVAAAAACSSLQTVSAFAPTNRRVHRNFQSSTSLTTRLYSELPSREMSQMGFVHEDPHRKKRSLSSLLSAVAIDTPSSWEASVNGKPAESLFQEIQPILSAALLITGSTVGASCLVLPETAAKPGMAVSTALFLGTCVLMRLCHAPSFHM
jgi:hypothetical protein